MIPIPAAGVLREVRGLDAARGVPGIEELTISAHIGKTLIPLPEGLKLSGVYFQPGRGSRSRGEIAAASARASSNS